MKHTPPHVVVLISVGAVGIPWGLAGCADAEPVGVVRSATIWGSDDRRDWHEVSADRQDLGQRSVGLLARRTLLGFETTPLRAQLRGGGTRREGGFCDDQPFLDQPRYGNCSGTLIDGDLFITAGHCLGVTTPANPTAAEVAEIRERTQRWCDQAIVLFNHRETNPGQSAEVVTDRDVYYCHEVLVHQFVPLFGGNSPASNSSDIAIFSLKRNPDSRTSEPVTDPYAPAPVTARPRQEPAVAGEVLGVGFPMGLPMKFKAAPLLQVEGSLWAQAALDNLGGDSGGGMFARIDGRLRHVAVYSHAVVRCGGGSQRESLNTDRCLQHAGSANECYVDPATDRPGANNWSEYSLSYRAIDSLCGGRGIGTAPPILNLRGDAHPSFLCGTAPPVSPVAYVPTPASPGTPPPPRQDTSTDSNCSAGGSPSGLVAIILMLLVTARRRSALLTLVPLGFLVACATGSTPSTERSEGDRVVEPALGHVVSFLRLPESEDAFGADLNEDGVTDAKLGRTVELFDSLGISLDDTLNRSIEGGRLQLLFETRIEGAEVMTLVYDGIGDAPLESSGNGRYRRMDAPQGVFVGTGGTNQLEAAAEAEFPLRVYLPEGKGSIVIPLRQARLEGRIGGRFLTGSIAAAVPVASLQERVFEPVAAFVNELLQEDTGCPAACRRPSLSIALLVFDRDRNDAISAVELAAPLHEALEPDIDLDGDGVLDALSVAVQIEAVRAAFAD
ncbi:MAG: trypsin-like peptidase domain-containing protein [Myxococcota bacterium]